MHLDGGMVRSGPNTAIPLAPKCVPVGDRAAVKMSYRTSRVDLIRLHVTRTGAKRVPKGPVRQRGRKAPTALRGGGAAAVRGWGGLKQ
jgi:hypothetical protein